ncbi:vacuolar protein sorting-associated protein 18 homolog [Tubulanus polymorphus]|uniref:vacuolar protein sorting-associated protein 18 homolog n=1 Tax=Tubulanus polymorphus TaxID=672921 RepID=UPI003DA1E1EE
MASMIDQYEQQMKRTRSNATTQGDISSVNSNPFLNDSSDDELPIFNKNRINFRPPDPITHLVASNNFLVIAMRTNVLLRIDLDHPDNPDEVEIVKNNEDSIHKIFLDPTGRHLIISMTSTDAFYVNRASKKPKHLSKMKGHLIESIGWNRQNTNDNSTSEIIIGTNQGLIFETEIQSGEDSRFFQGSLEQYWRQLFNLCKDKPDDPVPVTGLEFDRMDWKASNEYKYFIMATTPGRMYQFIGTIPNSIEAPIFQRIFAQYEDLPGRFVELPGGNCASQLQLFHPKFRAAPKSFAWITGPGIYYGSIDLTGGAGEETVTAETKLIPYQQTEDLPVAIVLTEFHVLTLFRKRLKAVCVLNDQLIFDDVFTDKLTGLRGMCKDPLRGTIWAFTDKAVFKYKLMKEARNVWQIFLDKGDFENARRYGGDNPANMDKVLTKQAEHLFKEGKYEESALRFARSLSSFEEIALKFVQVEDKEALKIFLKEKLSAFGINDKMQITMIVLWLIEIYLNQLGSLREQGFNMNSKYDQIQESFYKFLAQSKVLESILLNKTTVYDLIASHGDIDALVYFAFLIKDYERVLEHHIQHDHFEEALKVLLEHGKDRTDLYYKYSPLLMQNIPRDTVSSWIHMARRLDPKRLIPALVQYDHNTSIVDEQQGNEVIRYLEFCVRTLDNKDQSIHNYLLSLYVKLNKLDELMTYLTVEGEDQDIVHYDLKYALRLCSQHGLKRPCVHIYSTMNLFDEAVDLALQVDVDLAKKNADKPSDNEELRKKLWLRIARHVVEEDKDIKKAMQFVQECNLLKIEDVLPFFPDFVTIDHFKDAICESLEEYNEHIETLKTEMNEATESAKEIRDEIQTFRNKFAFVKGQDKCTACNYPLLTRKFYLFPCMHRFHMDCLIAEVMPHLPARERSAVDELQRALSTSDQSQGLLKTELDEIVASECIYCGDYMIRCIDKPFIDAEEEEMIKQSWS